MVVKMLGVGLMVLGVVGTASAAEETVTARAAVVDGNTLRLDGQAIRLWGIAVRRLVGALRVRGRWDRAQALAERDEQPVSAAAEEAVLTGIDHGELGAALRDLSPELVAVVQATILDGLTTKEAAQLLHIPRSGSLQLLQYDLIRRLARL